MPPGTRFLNVTIDVASRHSDSDLETRLRDPEGAVAYQKSWGGRVSERRTDSVPAVPGRWIVEYDDRDFSGRVHVVVVGVPAGEAAAAAAEAKPAERASEAALDRTALPAPAANGAAPEQGIAARLPWNGGWLPVLVLVGGVVGATGIAVSRTRPGGRLATRVRNTTRLYRGRPAARLAELDRIARTPRTRSGRDSSPGARSSESRRGLCGRRPPSAPTPAPRRARPPR